MKGLDCGGYLISVSYENASRDEIPQRCQMLAIRKASLQMPFCCSHPARVTALMTSKSQDNIV